MLIPQEIIRKKRDGLTLSGEEIEAFIAGVAQDKVTEGQIAAFTMATYFQGMSRNEAVALTRAMRDSGRVLDWRGLGLPGPTLDKHSTGGVGDVVSLMLGPIVAACGGYVPMISGRGLGHTGGTLDKLDSVPGYRTNIGIDEFQRVVRDVGVAIIGQTAELAPADKRIYATRDVTSTVESIPLITASILSKKLAAGLDALVMDVKAGSGAFMPTLEKSRALAESICAVGTGAGMKTSALITDMSQPLAPCAGNAIEVRCAIDYLSGKSQPPRLHAITLALCAEMLVLAGLSSDLDQAREKCAAVLSNAKAAEKFAQMISALGGPATLMEQTAIHLPLAPCVLDVNAEKDGVVVAMDTRAIGMAVVALGGGRLRAADAIDPRVGIDGFVELGQRVRAGESLATVYAASEDSASAAVANLRAAITVADVAVETPPLIYA